MTETALKSTVSIVLLVIAMGLIACVFSACSSFNADATVNAITGNAKISIQSTK